MLHVPRVLEVMARGWESLNAKAEVARVHRELDTVSRQLDVVPSTGGLLFAGRSHAGRELP